MDLNTWSPSWSGDGRWVLAQGAEDTRVWRVDEPEAVHTFEDVAAAAFVPGTNTVATAAAGRLDLVDPATGAVLASQPAPEQVSRLQVSADGGMVALADRVGRKVNVISLGVDEPAIVIGHTSPLEIHFSPDGDSLSIGGNEDDVRVVDLDSRSVVHLRGHGTGTWRHAFTPDGDRLLAVSLDGTTRVWNLEPTGPRELGNVALEGAPLGSPVATGSSVVAAVQTGSNDAAAFELDIGTGKGRKIADFWFGLFNWPVVAPDGSLVAGYLPAQRVAAVIDVESGETLTKLRACETPKAIDARDRWVLVVDQIECPEPAPDVGAASPRAGLVDLDSGELVTPISGAGSVLEAVVGPPATPAADLLAYSTGGQVVFRQASTGEPITAWSVPPDVVPLGLAFAPDGSALGVSAQTREGILFDVEAILAGASAPDAVRVFEEMSTGPTDRVVPVGDHLVTTGGAVRQWEAASGSLVAEVAANPRAFAHLLALPDGRTLFYADAGMFRRYLVEVEDLVELARSRVQRGFTESECGRFITDGECIAS